MALNLKRVLILTPKANRKNPASLHPQKHSPTVQSPRNQTGLTPLNVIDISPRNVKVTLRPGTFLHPGSWVTQSMTLLLSLPTFHFQAAKRNLR